MMRGLLPYLAGGAVCLLFVLLGAVFIPQAGAQYDELLFITAIYDPAEVEYVVKTPLGPLPLMLMSYNGTLKAAIYAPIFRFLGASHLTLRLPSLAIGALSIWLFYLFLLRLVGPRGALAAAVLLSTDAIYLLTCVFDWGPVALQHLLFASVLYALAQYASGGRRLWLFLAGLAGGLALWDKALFLWLVAGFAAALLLVFARELVQLARSPSRLAALALGLVLGAAPLLYYNARTRLKTVRENAQMGEEDRPRKLILLDRTFDGSGLFGYMVPEPLFTAAAPPGLKLWQKASAWANWKLHHPRKSWQSILLVLTLLIAPWLCWRGANRRVVLLLLSGGLVTYLMMFFTRSAGGSAHHTILVWPIPHLVAGLALGEVARRWPGRALTLCTGAFLLAAASNVAVLNGYLSQFVLAGPTTYWSDAHRPLVDALGREPGRLVFAADWGIAKQVEFYSNARIGFDHGADSVVVGLPEPLSATYLARSLADPRMLFVTHVEGREAFVGVRRKLLDFASARGYADHLLQVISDRHGAPVYEIHEFRK